MNETFVEKHMWLLLCEEHQVWPATSSARYELKLDTIRLQRLHYKLTMRLQIGGLDGYCSAVYTSYLYIVV